MNLLNFFEGVNPDIINYLILPLFLFLARIIDVSLGTLRIILISKGYRGYASTLGFIEVFIWITTVGQLLSSANSVFNYAAFAAGFATGTYVGMWLEGKISLGYIIVRVISGVNSPEMVQKIRDLDYSVTLVDGEGKYGEVKVIFMVIKRFDLIKVKEIINNFAPNAFYSIEDVRQISGGVFPSSENPVLQKNFLRDIMQKKK